mmetsp:Transcript_36687/g.93774  ORF Transcript_36687/g.93774 Transcript_36687/m.93774 type:complete len:229 (-) Transcript_36687:255-941(-)
MSAIVAPAPSRSGLNASARPAPPASTSPSTLPASLPPSSRGGEALRCAASTRSVALGLLSITPPPVMGCSRCARTRDVIAAAASSPLPCTLRTACRAPASSNVCSPAASPASTASASSADRRTSCVAGSSRSTSALPPPLCRTALAPPAVQMAPSALTAAASSGSAGLSSLPASAKGLAATCSACTSGSTPPTATTCSRSAGAATRLRSRPDASSAPPGRCAAACVHT